MNYLYHHERRMYFPLRPPHPHSMADIFEALNPGEACVEHAYPPIPVRDQDWQAYFYDECGSWGSGRTREEAAINALLSGWTEEVVCSPINRN